MSANSMFNLACDRCPSGSSRRMTLLFSLSTLRRASSIAIIFCEPAPALQRGISSKCASMEFSQASLVPLDAANETLFCVRLFTFSPISLFASTTFSSALNVRRAFLWDWARAINCSSGNTSRADLEMYALEPWRICWPDESINEDRRGILR